jgi:putative ABC transport system substrate-binding protein
MKRRQFIAGFAGTIVATLGAARAQQTGKIRRVGFLSGRARPESFETDAHGAFLSGMRDFGYVEGRDFAMEWRFAAGQFDRLPALAAELVSSNVDVIVSSPAAASVAAKNATPVIPIIFVYVSNPVALGLVASLARPGGNVTGLSVQLTDAAPKWLQLLSEAVPGLTRVAVVANPANAGSVALVKSVHAALEQTRIALWPINASTPQELEDGFAATRNGTIGGVLVLPDPFFASQKGRIAGLALKHQMPSMFADPDFVEAGGLMSYGDPLGNFMKRAAYYVDQVFKGAKLPDLPVQQPTGFEFAVNLKTAALLGLKLPPTLIAVADRVIE